ncbi:ras-related protein Rab-21-like [Diorhabda carinulata]|uniref:ras-related protein Rab-21-like n=1 Tax=Diorhabda carinulata TaxID=1163345 RepID=UPI0024E17D28|nr:ras-related protein Rab-21-like isoform X2 [Diorhabda sublineata]XP_057651788.1 ras-related protein Rab-21-like [Diorhabda carinulata]
MANTSDCGDTFNFKVVLLGEGCVGKTSLVIRYIEDKFNPKHISTIQASFLTKKLNLDGNRVNLSIWDTAGQEKFHALGPIYYRSSNGAVLVYDITDEDSFQKVKSWVKELRKMLGSDISLVIVGNKSDLEKDRHVDLEVAKTYAEKVKAMHYQTSAKLNEGVEEMFLALTQKMLDEAKLKAAQEINQTRKNSQKVVQVVDDEQVPNNNKTCCSSS